MSEATGQVEVLYPGCYAIRLPRVDDAIVPGKCPNCKTSFGYGEVARRVTDRALICAYDCRS